MTLKKASEPKDDKKNKMKKNIFVVQKHFSKNLHFDFRLQIGNVLKSWAIPKGPSKSTKDKRLAILVEDHPISYAAFEGEIPKGQYGAGTVEIWDRGYFENFSKKQSLKKCFENGHLEINLIGKKLKGKYSLIHFKEKNWLLIKMVEPLAKV